MSLKSDRINLTAMFAKYYTGVEPSLNVSAIRLHSSQFILSGRVAKGFSVTRDRIHLTTPEIP